MILTIIAKLTGFVREITLSYFYGTSIVSDAFLISLTIPSVIFAFIGTGIATGYIPMYNRVLEDKGQGTANGFTNNLVNCMFLLCTLIIILVFMFTESIVKVFAMGFSGDQLAKTIYFTKITILAIYFLGVVNVFIGYLQMKGNFKIPQLLSLPSNLFWVIGIYLASRYSDSLLAISSVVVAIIQMLYLWIWVKKNNFIYSFKIDFKDKYIKKLVYLSIPLILGTSVNQINTLVDRNIASTLGDGGITVLNYANKLNSVIIGLFATTVVTVLYPKISQMVVKKNKKGIIDSLNESIVIINIIVIPIMIGSMIFSEELIKVLFGRGAFSGDAIKKTGDALFYYSVGMLGFGLREILARVFYAYQDNKTPMINAAIGMGLNIVLNIILSKYMGISGLAFATSISAIITALMMGYTLRRKIGAFGILELSKTTMKIFVASSIMGVVAKIFYEYTKNIINGNLSFVLAVILGGSTYIVILLFMKIKDVDILFSLIKNKISKN